MSWTGRTALRLCQIQAISTTGITVAPILRSMRQCAEEMVAGKLLQCAKAAASEGAISGRSSRLLAHSHDSNRMGVRIVLIQNRVQ